MGSWRPTTDVNNNIHENITHKLSLIDEDGATNIMVHFTLTIMVWAKR